MQSLLKNHPFVDGNKRTALTSAGIFLLLTDRVLRYAYSEEVEFTIHVDNHNLSLEEITVWLEEHAS